MLFSTQLHIMEGKINTVNGFAKFHNGRHTCNFLYVSVPLYYRALDKKEYLMIIFLISLVETVQMRGHNMLLCIINKNFP